MPLSGKSILFFAAPLYEDLELWYPKIRLEEDGATWEMSGDDDMGTGELLVWAEDGWQGEHVIQVRGNKSEAIDVHVLISVE